MGDQIAEAAGKLVPLLLLLLVVFGSLILLAVLLRAKVRAERGARRRGRRQPGQFQDGDVVSVLGRSFSVERVEQAGESDTLLLLGGERSARLIWHRGREQASYFPGRLDSLDGAADLPELLLHDQVSFERSSPPGRLADGTRLGIYQASSGQLLLVEAGQQLLLWRGKAIPAEGVELIED